MELEKGKNYLVLDQTTSRNIFEIEVLENTKSCYKLSFKSTVNNVFKLDMFNENTKWYLKSDFEKMWNFIEELPARESGRNIVDSILNNTTTTMEDLFCKKEGKKEKKK